MGVSQDMGVVLEQTKWVFQDFAFLPLSLESTLILANQNQNLTHHAKHQNVKPALIVDGCNQCALCALCLGSTSGLCDKCKYCKDGAAGRKKECKKGKNTSICKSCIRNCS